MTHVGLHMKEFLAPRKCWGKRKQSFLPILGGKWAADRGHLTSYGLEFLREALGPDLTKAETPQYTVGVLRMTPESTQLS